MHHAKYLRMMYELCLRYFIELANAFVHRKLFQKISKTYELFTL